MWDLLIVLLAMVNTVTVPLEIALSQVNEAFSYPRLGFFINITVDFLFLMDFVMGFFTSHIYRSTGEYCYNLKKTAKHYLYSSFTVDFLAILSPIASHILWGL